LRASRIDNPNLTRNSISRKIHDTDAKSSVTQRRFGDKEPQFAVVAQFEIAASASCR
jgi:hypothetical protein